MNRSAEQTNRPRTASRFTRFVCPALRFIPHEPRKKDTHSLNELKVYAIVFSWHTFCLRRFQIISSSAFRRAPAKYWICTAHDLKACNAVHLNNFVVCVLLRWKEGIKDLKMKWQFKKYGAFWCCRLATVFLALYRLGTGLISIHSSI